MIDIEKSKAICEAALSGPWEVLTSQNYPECARWDIRGLEIEEGHGLRYFICQGNYSEPIIPGDIGCEEQAATEKATMDFIAHARTALPLALTEIERLREALEKISNLSKDQKPPDFDEYDLGSEGRTALAVARAEYKAASIARKALGEST